MPRPAIEMLRAQYDAITRQDWDAVFDDVHPDFELKTPDASLTEGTYRGRHSARQTFEDFFEPYEEVHAEPEEFFEGADRIVVYFVLRCRPKGSSAMVEIRAGHLWVLRDGKLASLEIFPRRERALEAAGLPLPG